jgi:FkbM family methyltransferase
VIFPYAEGSPLRFSEEVFEALVYHWRDVRVLDSYDATRFITPGMTVVDAGANIGMFSLLANGLVGSSGQVYAVEPVPGNLQCLEQCLERNQLTRVKTCGTALGAENGALALSLSSSSGKHSAALDRGGPQITVPQRRLDDLVEEWGLDRLDFLKIDVEGYEPQVLRGAAGCISKFRPVLAVAAYHFPEHVEALPQLIAGIAEDYVVRVGSAARGLETKCWGIPVERGSAGGGRHTR